MLIIFGFCHFQDNYLFQHQIELDYYTSTSAPWGIIVNEMPTHHNHVFFYFKFNLINVHAKIMGIKPTLILSLFHLSREKITKTANLTIHLICMVSYYKNLFLIPIDNTSRNKLHKSISTNLINAILTDLIIASIIKTTCELWTEEIRSNNLSNTYITSSQTKTNSSSWSAANTYLIPSGPS